MKKQIFHSTIRAAVLALSAGVSLAQVINGPNGDVGIGVSPASKLDVAARMRVRGGDGATTPGIWLWSAAGGDRAFMGLFDDNKVGWWGNAGAAWNVVMDVRNGNTGIGTTAPEDRLHINGDLRLGVDGSGRNIRSAHRLHVQSGEDLYLNPWSGGVYVGHGGGPGNLVASGTISSTAASPSHFGSLELGYYNGAGQVAGIDFHNPTYPGQDFNVRIINDANNVLNIGSLTGPVAFNVGGKVSCTSLELTCDRDQKGGFKPANHREDLAKVNTLPITTWAYTNSPSVRHRGPMAQDFKAAFPDLGEDDKHISAVDGIGVALSAIKGLHELVQEKDSKIAALERQVASMKRELAGVKENVTDRLAALENAVSKRDVQQASFRPEAAR